MTEVLRGGGRERPLKKRATGREKPFSFSNQLLHFSNQLLHFSVDTICLRVERERASLHKITFFPVAKEQEMVDASFFCSHFPPLLRRIPCAISFPFHLVRT